jgi:hypothetical protein
MDAEKNIDVMALIIIPAGRSWSPNAQRSEAFGVTAKASRYALRF